MTWSFITNLQLYCPAEHNWEQITVAGTAGKDVLNIKYTMQKEKKKKAGKKTYSARKLQQRLLNTINF